MAEVDYYLSLNSPWTYLGSAEFLQMCADSGHVINCYPVKLPVVFEHSGGLPLPKRSDQRKAYRMQELKRWRTRRNIPIDLEPAHFPSDEWPGVQRVYAAALMQKEPHSNDAARLASEIGRAIWERNEDAAKPNVLDTACERAGLDSAALVECAATNDIAGKYEAATQAAITAGVIGAPTYVVGSDMFWGQDRLDFLRERLADA